MDGKNKKQLVKKSVQTEKRELATPTGLGSFDKYLRGESTRDSLFITSAITGTSGDQVTNAISAMKSNKRSILGANQSLYAMISDIKESIAKMDIDNAIKGIKDAIGGMAKATNVSDKPKESINYSGILESINQEISGIRSSIDNSIIKVIEAINAERENINIIEKVDARISKDSLSEIKNAIENNFKETNGKIKVTVDGLNEKDIDALRKFSEMNMNALGVNAEWVSTLVEILSKTKPLDMSNSNKNLAQIAEILDNTAWIFSKPRVMLLNAIMAKGGSIENLVGKNGAMSGLFEKLKTIKLDEKMDFTNTIDALKDVSGLMDKVIKMMPYFILINKTSMAKTVLDSINGIKDIIDASDIWKDGSEYPKIKKSISDTNEAIDIIMSTVKSIQGYSIAKSFLDDGKINQIRELFEHNIKSLLREISSNKKDYTVEKNTTTQIKNSIEDIISIVDKISTQKGNDIDKVKKTLIGIASLFGISVDGKKMDINIMKNLFQSLGSLKDVSKQQSAKIDSIANQMESIKTILESINSISELKKIDKDKIISNISNYFETINEIYKEIDSKIDKIYEISSKVDGLKAANEKIKEGMESINDVAVKTQSSTKEIEDAQVNIEGMTKFIIASTIVLSVGALFVMLGGGKFIKASIEFAATLSLFEALVLLPVITTGPLLKKAMPLGNQMNGFILTCVGSMMIGALFVMLGGGKALKASLMFGIALMAFETLVIAPFILFGKFMPTMKANLEGFEYFMLACVGIMTIGALFMMLDNGTFVKNAINFGITLMIFEAMVLAPILLFSHISKDAKNSLDEMVDFMIASAAIMTIGALFMMIKNGAYAKYALEFGLTLMAFEALVLAPFLVMSLLAKDALKGAKLFSGLTIVTTAIMTIGALFMMIKNGAYAKYALEFGATLMTFEALVLAPFLVFGLFAKKAKANAIELLGLIAVSATILIVGSLTYEYLDGVESPLAFTILLSAFIAGMTHVFNWVSGNLSRTTINELKEFSLLVAISAAILVVGSISMKITGPLAPLEFAGLLSGFVLVMSKAMGLMSKAIGKNPKVLADAAVLGTFVLMTSISLSLGAMFVAKYGLEPVIQYGVILLAFVGSMSLVLGLLGALSPALLPGEAAAIGLGVALLALTTSLTILGTLFDGKLNIEAINNNISAIEEIVSVGLLWMFVKLSIVGLQASLGIYGALAISGALLALSTTFKIIDIMLKETDVESNFDKLNDIIGLSMAWFFEKLILLLPFAILGGTSALLISTTLLALSGSLKIVSLIMEDYSSVKSGLDNLTNLISGKDSNLWALFGKIIALGAVSILARPAVRSFSSTMKILSNAMVSIAEGEEAINKMNISDNSEEVIKNINAFISIGNGIDKDGLDKLKKNIRRVRYPISELSTVMMLVGSTVKDLADMKVAIAWDKNGNAIRWRQISQSDFDLAKDNIKDILNNTFEGLSKALEVIDDSKRASLLKKVINSSLKIGDMISNIALGISNMAILSVANSFDQTTGKPTSFKRLSESHFSEARQNIKQILTNTFDALKEVYNDLDNSNLLDSDFLGLGSTPIDKIVNASMNVSNMISAIVESLFYMASMEFPVYENGKIAKYQKIGAKEFDDANANILKIITDQFDTLESLAQRPDLKNALSWDTWFTRSDAGKIIKMAMDMSSMISNLATGISMMATMQIANRWDPKTGKPIGYVKVTDAEMIEASNNVVKIINALLGGGENGIKFNKISSNKETIKKAIESVNPISEMISSLADGIVKLASGQVPNKWNNDGVAIGYDTINSETYVKIGEVVGDIITAVPKALIELANDKKNKKFFDGGNNPQLKDIIESVSGVTEIVSSIADSVVKFAQGKIPVYKDGKIIRYDDINFGDENGKGGIVEKLSTVISSIITATSDAIINCYNANDKMFSTTGENTPFSTAVNGISSSISIVSNLVSAVVSLGNARLPKRIDPKTGNVLEYEDLGSSVDKILENLKKIIDTGDGKSLLMTIPTMISTLYEKISTGNLNKNIDEVKNFINPSIEMISSVAKTIVDISSYKIPLGFDKDGKANGYEVFNQAHIGKMKENALNMINALSGIFNDVNLKTNVENALKNSDDINKNITSIINNFEIIVSGLKGLHEDYSGTIAKILEYNRSKDKSLANDIVTVINSFSSALSDESKINMISKSISDKISDGILSTNDAIRNIISTLSNVASMYSEYDFESMTSRLNALDPEKILQMVSKISTMISNADSTLPAYARIDNIQKFINQSYKVKNLIESYIDVANSIGNLRDAIQKNNITLTDVDMKVEDLPMSVMGAIKSKISKIREDINSIGYSSKGLGMMASDLDRLSRAINNTPVDIDKKINSLKQSLDNISKIDETNIAEFNNQVESIDKYVNTVNSIDIKKANSMAEIASQMRSYVTQLSKMDSVADMLYKLSRVLEEVNSSLHESKDVVEGARMIQDKRTEKMNESIKTIKEIMDKELIVRVSSDTTENTDDYNSNSISTATPEYNNLIGTEYGKGATPNSNDNNSLSKQKNKANEAKARGGKSIK